MSDPLIVTETHSGGIALHRQKITPVSTYTKMSTTQNVKGNRQIVVAHCESKQYFKIPDGLDLEDKTVVSNWSVSWGKLYIDYVDGRKTTDIIEFVEEHNYGFKDPEYVIEDAKTDEHNIAYEEDKEE